MQRIRSGPIGPASHEFIMELTSKNISLTHLLPEVYLWTPYSQQGR